MSGNKSKAKKHRRRRRRRPPNRNLNNNNQQQQQANDVDTDKLFIKIWCRKYDIHDSIYDQMSAVLDQNSENSFAKFKQKTIDQVEAICSKINFDSDPECATTGKTVCDAFTAMQLEYEEERKRVEAERARQRKERSHRRRKKCKSKKKRKAGGKSLGFAVGGAGDVNTFRDTVNGNKMPSMSAISYEGIFYEYYFDTQTNAGGEDVSESDEEGDGDQEQPAITDDTKQSENENENEQDDVPLFYPTYCYAKTAIPEALLMANIDEDLLQQTPNTVTGTKRPKKKGRKLKSKKKSAVSSTKTEQNTDTGTKEPRSTDTASDMVVDDDYNDAVIDLDDTKREDEYFMTVGLNSTIDEDEFERTKLNLCILLDISGSMGSRFRSSGSSNSNSNTKMQVANKSVIALISHLNSNDRFSLVTFNTATQTILTLKKLKQTPMFEMEKILYIGQGGGTNFEAGFLGAVKNFSRIKMATKAQQAYDNRIIMLTDACPNRGRTDEHSLLGMVKRNALDQQKPIFSTFVGVGLDFNTDLISRICKVRGCNYFSVHSNADFLKKMDADFKYIVSPLVFNLRLVLKAEGDQTKAVINRVYGSDDINIAEGEILKVETLFPSPVDDEGDTKGGIVLLKLVQQEQQTPYNLEVSVTYEDKYGKTFSNKQLVTLGDGDDTSTSTGTQTQTQTMESSGNTNNSKDYFDNSGVQKGILLTRYVLLIKQWILECSGSATLNVPNKWKTIFHSFSSHFEQQMSVIGDKSLSKEIDMLQKLMMNTKKTKTTTS